MQKYNRGTFYLVSEVDAYTKDLKTILFARDEQIDALKAERDRYKYEPVLQEMIEERDKLLAENAQQAEEIGRLKIQCLVCKRPNVDIGQDALKQKEVKAAE